MAEPHTETTATVEHNGGAAPSTPSRPRSG